MRDELQFLWWNVNDFGHDHPDRIGEARWPSSRNEYEAKLSRMEEVFRELFPSGNWPQVIGLTEITRQAAIDLRERLFPGFEVHSLDILRKPDFQPAILYRPEDVVERDLVTIPDAHRGTHHIATVDLRHGIDRFRVFACHWTAKMGDDQGKTQRTKAAQALAGAVYEFLRTSESSERHHVLILGDLNEEPFEERLTDFLHADRARDSARRRPHYTDEDIRRTRLYNCAWRLLGERRPHGTEGAQVSTAGTYYWRERKKWYTLDHVIVSGTLLGDDRPLLDEASVEVAVTDGMLGADRLPMAFTTMDPRRGASDHLPIRGTILLPKGESDE